MKSFSIFTGVLLFFFLLITDGHVQAQDNFVLRPYGKIGFLLTPPSTADLDYSIGGVAGGLDDAQDVKTLNLGLGVQVLKNRVGAPSLGGEIGFQNLFHSTVSGALVSGAYLNNDIDIEYDLYLGPLIEFSQEESPVYFQAGVDLHIVFWKYIAEYESVYSSSYYESGGKGVSFGIHGSVGTQLELSPTFSIPLAIRTDVILRYGVLWQVGLIVGLNLQQ